MRRWVVSLSFLNNCIRLTETSAMAVVNCSSKLDQDIFNKMTLGLWSHTLLLTWKCSYSLCAMVQHHYKFHRMTFPSNWEDFLQSCTTSVTQSYLQGSQRYAQYFSFCFNKITFQTVRTLYIAIDDLTHIAQSSNERRKQIKIVDFLRSMVYFLRKIEMRSGDLDTDMQIKDIDEKL